MINTNISEDLNLKFYAIGINVWGYTTQNIPEGGVLKTRENYIDWANAQNDLLVLGSPGKEEEPNE
jgi:hypothetical protein